MRPISTRPDSGRSGRWPGPDSRSSRTRSASSPEGLRIVRGWAVPSTDSRKTWPRGAWTRTLRRESSSGRRGLERSELLPLGLRSLPVDRVEELLETGHAIPPCRFQGGDVDVVPFRPEKLEHPKSVVAHELPRIFLRLLGISEDRKSTRLNSSHSSISYAVFCLKKKNIAGNTLTVDDYAH